ncbi:uncharacterized protein N7477_005915 [Penicillium maclennaniae]|uniref:uncharacterized protein n=1 Tax=Penicillium maclennaniae TaxID=1343394 RepID=UPI00253FE8BF|nr:uncharacterized protein N7477_005915 [Penicillium maclennaniae]KAJ5670552.1 hypothetical protein N7477_005915 [Penicillium maclennaniae]
MSRKIDRLGEPASKRPMKLIVASPSRSGTLGLYRALQFLGFKAYHSVECLFAHGVTHMEIMNEAVTAQHNRFSGIQRYSDADFKKWFAEYDCLVEVPSFFGMSAIKAYADDPNVKFILTERDPDKWVASFNKTAGATKKMADSFPLVILRYFDGPLNLFLNLNQTICWALSDKTKPGEPENAIAMRRNYIEYIEMAKKTIPAERLCYIRLENGLGWEQICPFLEMPIPDQEYPDRNEPARFEAIVAGLIKPMVTRAIIRLATIAVPAIGALGWAAWKHGPALSTAIAKKL